MNANTIQTRLKWNHKRPVTIESPAEETSNAVFSTCLKSTN